MLLRTRVGVATTVVVGAVGAAAIAHAGPLLPLHTAGANANRAAARVDARRILSLARLPAGASDVSADPAPSSLLKSAFTTPGALALVDLHRFYRLPGSPDDALSWLRAYPPADTQLFGSGTTSGPNYQVDALVFSLRPNHRESTRSLVLSVTAARGGGTALRVDAQVVWIVPRPSTEAIPPGVRFVTASGRSVDILTGRVTTTGPIDVAAPGKVARVIRLVNGLPLVQPGIPFACPLDTGAGAVLKFYDERGGPVVAQADAGASGCGLVSFWLHGTVEPALSGGPGLIDGLNRLLGTHL